jgi:hypothetical protein
MESLKNNKLIAEFMGGCEPEEFEEYNTDWNWLMQVVEKINTSDYTVEIHSMDTRIYNNNTGKIIFQSECKWQTHELLNSVYEAVVEFIKWYNKNN